MICIFSCVKIQAAFSENSFQFKKIEEQTDSFSDRYRNFDKMSTKIMKTKITFTRDELTLTGNLFTTINFDKNKKYNTVIIEGSATSVKEQMPQLYAEKFANEGFVVLAFDYSHYGESEGNPRQLESPEEKLKDLKAAVSYLTQLPYVKSIGMVGVCTSGGNISYVGAEDNRVKALASVAGYLPDEKLVEKMFGKEEVTRRRNVAAEARILFNENGTETSVTSYSEVDKSAANYNPTVGAYDYYTNPKRGGVPQYKNELSVMSWETFLDFDPIARAAKVTTPTIVIHSDGCAFPEQAKKFYAELKGEKELIWGDGNHFDYYDNPKQVDFAVGNIVRFFNTKL